MVISRELKTNKKRVRTLERKVQNHCPDLIDYDLSTECDGSTLELFTSSTTAYMHAIHPYVHACIYAHTLHLYVCIYIITPPLSQAIGPHYDRFLIIDHALFGFVVEKNFSKNSS